MSPTKRIAGPSAALFWFLFCVRFFDVAEPMRPGWLRVLPGPLLLLLALCWLGVWLTRRERLWHSLPEGSGGALFLVILLSVLFRLPLATWGAWGYTTADGSLSGILALHARDGVAHDVFVPSVAYSGSLKAELTALLSAVTGIEIVRAFALTSVLFHALFTAAAFRLGALAGGAAAARAAGMWAVFAPTFVNWYSLSNDGNYVEVLALGTWALVLAARLVEGGRESHSIAAATGLLLGLGFWCHILAVTHATAIVLASLVALRLRSAPVLLWMGTGFALGDLPGLLWNAAHDWASFRYLVPSGYWEAARSTREAAPGAASLGLLERVRLALVDHGPILFGYDAGYPGLLDGVSRGLAWLGLLAFLGALAAAARQAFRSRRVEVHGLLLLFTATNVGAALIALPHIVGNPRYLLFLFAPACALVGSWLCRGRRALVLFALFTFGALGSLGQARAKLAEASAWRGFVADLRREGVRHCYTDYYLAARIDFFASLDPLCSSKLGPITTEYFLEHRERVDRAAAVDIVAINGHSALRIERRLQQLGVSYERRDLMKPVLLRLSRKVDPRELFPGRDFRPR